MRLMWRMKGNLEGNRKKFALCVCEETFDVGKKIKKRTFVSIFSVL